MIDLFLELPFPPTVNSYYSKTQRGIYISRKGREFRDMCATECREQNAYGLKLDLRLCLDVILYPPDKRTRDLDNYMKALQDSLSVAKVWLDDEQIDELHIHRGVQVKSGKCAIRISEHHGLLMPDNMEVWDHLD